MWFQILDVAVCISLHPNTSGKEKTWFFGNQFKSKTSYLRQLYILLLVKGLGKYTLDEKWWQNSTNTLLQNPTQVYSGSCKDRSRKQKDVRWFLFSLWREDSFF